jgi:hypothetical protein
LNLLSTAACVKRIRLCRENINALEVGQPPVLKIA